MHCHSLRNLWQKLHRVANVLRVIYEIGLIQMQLCVCSVYILIPIIRYCHYSRVTLMVVEVCVKPCKSGRTGCFYESSGYCCNIHSSEAGSFLFSHVVGTLLKEIEIDLIYLWNSVYYHFKRIGKRMPVYRKVCIEIEWNWKFCGFKIQQCLLSIFKKHP